MRMGLDLGTGFVKCVSDYGSVRFPSVYAKQACGSWSEKTTEAVGDTAARMIDGMGVSAIRPILRGRPDSRYQRQAALLIQESLRLSYRMAKMPVNADEKIRIAVGLPYYAFDVRQFMGRLLKKTLNIETCVVAAQASGTLVDLNLESGLVVSIGQGTTEMVVIDDFEVMDGNSSRWASDYITKKLGRFAHLDVDLLQKNKTTCIKYAKILAENLALEIREMADSHNNRYSLALSGGGLLIPGVRDELASRLGGLDVAVPDDPVMSNARGLYKMI